MMMTMTMTTTAAALLQPLLVLVASGGPGALLVGPVVQSPCTCIRSLSLFIFSTRVTAVPQVQKQSKNTSKQFADTNAIQSLDIGIGRRGFVEDELLSRNYRRNTQTRVYTLL